MVIGSHSNEEWERLMDEWGWEEEAPSPPKPILDLDAIYEDGKLFGRKLRYLDYEDWDGNPDVCRFVIFDYKEKPYKVRLKFSFEDSVIDLWTAEYDERTGHYTGASTAITFKEFYNETKEIANKIFEDNAKMIIAATRRNLGEND